MPSFFHTFFKTLLKLTCVLSDEVNKMLNELILIGRIGSQPESTETKNGTKLVTISLPLFHSYTPEGRKTEWIQCRAFGKLGNIVEMAKKGVLVAVKGEIHNPTWEDENGNKKSRAYVVIESFRFLEKKKTDEGESSEQESVNDSNEIQVPSIDDDIDGFLNGF
ncbi:hypothetical protein COA01_33450 [Bacillus cereus]|nr:hypothetical protein COA01_33450 [Bacillus cereus]